MRERGLEDYESFYRWSVDSREDFWQATISRLGIHFAQPPSRILNTDKGVEHAAWCDGAHLNVVESCFQADDNETAIVAQSPGGELRRTTVAQLRSLANRISNSLARQGYGKGDAIAVVLPMTELSVAIYLGIVQAGCIVVSIADSFAPPQIATRLKIAEVQCVITYDLQPRAGKLHPLYARVAEAVENLQPNTPSIIVIPAAKANAEARPIPPALRKDRDVAWNDFLVEDDTFTPVVCDANDTINILFSSGTTGEPKAIPWNHLTPIRCAVDGHVHHDIRSGDVVAWPTNLGWMMGPWLIFASLINRGTIALFEDAPVGTAFGTFVEKASVTMLGVVPTLVKNWRRTGDMHPCDWSAIRAFSSTGESSQPDDMRFLSSLAGNKPVIEYCGGTEIGGGYVSSVPVLPGIPSAFNTPAIGHQFVLLDENGTPGDQGEVHLIPPSIGLSSRLLNRDHYETYFAGVPTVAGLPPLRRHGDQFRKHSTEHGEYFVAGGRIDDTMNLGGIKVSSSEIERVLNQVEGIVETAAVASSRSAPVDGEPDASSEGGPTQLIVFAVVSDNPDEEALKQALNSQIKSRLNPLFKIARVILVDSMPRTASNKVMRRKLRESLQ